MKPAGDLAKILHGRKELCRFLPDERRGLREAHVLHSLARSCEKGTEMSEGIAPAVSDIGNEFFQESYHCREALALISNGARQFRNVRKRIRMPRGQEPHDLKIRVGARFQLP